MKIMIKMKVKMAIVFVASFLVSLPSFAQSDENPFAKMSIKMNNGVTYSACPGEPLFFELEDIDPVPVGSEYRFEWYTSTDGVTWNSKGAYKTYTYTLEMPDNAFYIKVHASQTMPHGLLGSVNETYVEKKIALSSNCKENVCHQTTTGDYFSGTDFDHTGSVDWSQTPPGNLEQFFSDQGIIFSETYSKNHPDNKGEVMNQEKLGYPLYIDDSLGVNPHNNFYVIKTNVNSGFFSIKFPNEMYKGKTYRFTMRFYLIIPNSCKNWDPGASIMTRTGHGTVTTDMMDVDIYYESENGTKSELIKSQYVTMGSDVARYKFYDDIKDYENLDGDKIFRFEMVYYGSMPADKNVDYDFQPFFEQFPTCATVAVDYISAEAASVCVSPRSECVGGSILVNAAGFPRNTEYVWTKYTDATYSTVEEWKQNEVTYELDRFGKKEKANIVMMEPGVFYYSVSDGINTINFSLVGMECGNAVCPDIKGDANVCVTNFPYKQEYALENESVMDWMGTYGVDYTYRWSLVAPEGLTSDASKVFVEDSPDFKKATIRVDEGARMSGSFSPDMEYQIVLSAYRLINGQMNAHAECSDTMFLWIYDQPSVSAVNLLTKQGQDSICAATASDTIMIENKGQISGYDWTWIGASMGADSVVRISNFNRVALCDGSLSKYPVSLDVKNGTCGVTLNDTFYVHTPDAPMIDCSDLSEDTVYYLSPSSLDTTINLPIPAFATSCDDNPKIGVNIRFDADEDIHDMDSSFVLSRSDIDALSKKIPFTFYAGVVYVDYTLTDGCGKSDNCNVSIDIKDTTAGLIDCGLIDDFLANITNQSGCVAVPGYFPSELPILKPDTLRDLNFKDTLIFIPGVFAGRSSLSPNSDPGLNPSKYSKEKGLNDPYEIGVTYILWSFTDPSGNVSYCHSKVTVINDREMFNCNSLVDIRTTVNKNNTMEYKYASAQPQGNRNPDTQYTLEYLLKVPAPSLLYCEGPVVLKIRFTGEYVDDDGNILGSVVDSLLSGDELLKHKFPVGVTDLKFVFTDKNKREVACKQRVIIASAFSPVPNDCPNDVDLYAGDECSAVWNLELENVPTAKIPYFKEVKYIYDNCDGRGYVYDDLGISTALSITYDTVGYPFMVRRISDLDEQWKSTSTSVVTECKNTYGASDSVMVKMVQHRRDDKSVCQEDAQEQMAVMLTNFSELPNCITNPFKKGRHEVVWYFDNGKGILDSCVTHIQVIDTVPPTLVCGSWSEADTFYVDESCVVPASVVDVHVPTVDSLQASDNCTDPEKMKVSWTRTFDGTQIPSLDDSYEMGVTYIKWIVTDESGNASYCEQTVTVLDTLPPFFDCSSLHTIYAFADADCEVKPDAVKAAGLKIPTTDEDDPCSPMGGVISGVGVRSDGKDVMTDPYPLDTTYISWTFTDAAGNVSKPCMQMVIVKDTTPPLFADCGNMPLIVIELDPDSCSASNELVRKKLGTHSAHDNCDGDIEGFPMLTLPDLSYAELPEFFKKDTTYLISWVFTDKKNNKKICHQSLEVRDTTPPDLTGVCPAENVKNVAAKVVCAVTYDDLQLPNLKVDDPCDGLLLPIVTGWIKQKDESVIVYRNEDLKTANYPIGTHHFSWVFTDKAGLKDSCEMDVVVTDSLDLILTNCDVDKSVTVTLKPGECSLSPDSLSKYMKIPVAYDLCDEDTILPIIERRFDGKLVVDEEGKAIAWNSQDFPLGKTDIKWLFVDELGVMKDSCEKSVTVKTELFDCSTLKEVVVVNLLEELFATASEVEAAGLKEPEITVDTCNAAELSFYRSDEMSRDDNYEIGSVDVKWTFTYSFGDVKECHQTVIVNDMVPPSLICPPLTDIHYECYGDIPTPYQTFEEFEAAGGSISDIRKYKEGSFGFSEDTIGANLCDYTLRRTYHIKDIRDTLVTCSQEFNVSDTKSPVILTSLDTLVFACDQVIPSMATIPVEVEDNCTDKSDIVIRMEADSSRSEDIHSCSYNSYTIWRRWTAVDKCGHVSDALTQVVLVVDTIAPKIVLPEGWRDTLLADNVKNCTRIMPVLDTLLKGNVVDACTLDDDIVLWQSPAAGTLVKETTDVYLFAKDNCGNRDSVKVVVFIDKVVNVVSLNANSLTLCGSDTSSIDLWSQEVRFAKGYVTVYDVDGLMPVNSVFNYDCYRDTISEATLVYSNNPHTYYSKFYGSNKYERDSIYKARVNLRKRTQSGLYYFVVMDTITRCKDTAMAYLTIHERPRISLSSDALDHCENDTFDLADLLADSRACVDDMGSDIVKSGWYVDDEEYVAGTPVPYDGKKHVMYYYAENSCARSTSYDSYFAYCGATPSTKADSLAIVGTEKNLELWRRDELHSEDSLLLIVHQRYLTDSIFLATNPSYMDRIWLGDELELNLTSPYKPSFYYWHKVSGLYDGRFAGAFDKYGNVMDSFTRTDVVDETLYENMSQDENRYRFIPTDSALYYVLIGDGVCPAMPSNVVSVDVMDKLPTAITPYNSIGLNDVFLKGRQVVIFDRYGDRVYEGSDGWDGSTRGGLVDPGVYFYDAVINGRNYKGTIEVVYIK